MRTIVVGAGMGGLAAALCLARHGREVTVLEGRLDGGGLASAVEASGLRFDGGPYILLDRPELEWAFAALGLDLHERVPLNPIEEVYEVATGECRVTFHRDMERTADGFERAWPGSSRRYRELVAWGMEAHRAFTPALRVSRPGLRELLRPQALRHASLAFRTLSGVLSAYGLPAPVREAIGIWTHVAGQRFESAPAFMALLPALIHGAGPAYPAAGMEALPRALLEAARSTGVDVRLGTAARAIRHQHGRVTGVETEAGFLAAQAVVSNVGIATYLGLLQPEVPAARAAVQRLPLQSPGIGAYLAVRGRPRPPYLRFRLPEQRDHGASDERCQLFISPAVLQAPATNGDAAVDGWWAARLLSPLDHALAESLGRAGQEARLERLLAEPWWREGFDDVRVAARRVPADWGAEFHLLRDAMNPAMTAHLARRGRLAHRSPFVRGLYLAGSGTHPGQWVSFCAISGILAAEALHSDTG